MNSDGVEKEIDIDTGKEKSIGGDGSGKSSNRYDLMAFRIQAFRQMKHSNGKVVKENGVFTIFDLPLELLVKIIDLVPITQWASLEFVSRSFQEVVHELWDHLHEIRLDELICNKEKKMADPCQIVETILEKFLIRAPSVASISGFDEFFDRRTPICLETIQLLSKFEHLESIDFSGQDITAELFAVFLDSSASRQSWKSLDISGGIFEKMNNHEPVNMENQPALNLECIKFSTHSSVIFNGFLQVDWSGLKKLVVLERFASAKDLLSIIRQCTQLAHLEIKIPECGDENGQPYFDFMQGVVALENLSVLKINGYWSLDIAIHDALLMLIMNLGRRCIIDFSLLAFYCTNQILDAIVVYLPLLKSLELDVTKCTTAPIERLANRMGHLESLKFRSSGLSVDGTVVRAICGNMSGLQRLHLDYLTNVKSDDFARLVDLRNLKELRITRVMVKLATIQSWTRLRFGSCLETLELYLGQDNISPKMMGDFVKKMPHLRSVKLTGSSISEFILKSIAKSCPTLVEFDIDRSSITLAGIQSIINRCSKLKILKVVGCGQVPEQLKMGKYRKITFKFDK